MEEASNIVADAEPSIARLPPLTKRISRILCSSESHKVGLFLVASVTAVVLLATTDAKPVLKGRYSISDTKSDQCSGWESNFSLYAIESCCHRSRHSSNQSAMLMKPVNAYYQSALDYKAI